MRFSFRNLTLLTAILVSLSACTGTAPIETSTTLTFTFAPPTITVEPTLTPEPTFTPFPTATATVTLIPTSTVGWANMSVTFSDLIVNYGVYFLIPGLDNVYDVSIDRIPFSCYIDKGYPNMLICYGAKFRNEVSVPVVFTTRGGNAPIYTSTLMVSSAMFESEYPECIPSTWCPDRYKNFSCETEDRNNFSPQCIVSTCVDACGFCVGIDTCTPQGSVRVY
jgi:hypothetical protein